MSYISVLDQLNDLKNNTSATNAKNSSVGDSSLDTNAFLKLLMAQLQYQDPLDPVDNSEFLNQQAMFTQVEELQNIGDALEDWSSDSSQASSIMQASSLIGKEVTYANPNYDKNDENSEEYITGKVTSANFYTDATTLVVDGEEILLGLVASVSEAGSGSSSDS